MTGSRRIVLNISPELYGRVETRAAADRFDTEEWVLRTVIGELLRPAAEVAAERRAREALARLAPATERKP